MKLSKIIIILVRLIILIPFIIMQLYVIIFTLPLLTSWSMVIGASLGILGQWALLYYLLFKCRYKWIKKIVKNLREPIEEQPTNS